jgi:hypothetical protein
LLGTRRFALAFLSQSDDANIAVITMAIKTNFRFIAQLLCPSTSVRLPPALLNRDAYG